MILVSGPNVPVPFDMGADPQNNEQTPTFLNGAIPEVGDTYLFQAVFSDGSTQNISASVGAVLNSFAQNLVASSNAPGTSIVPLLTWGAPASPPTSYTYSVSVSSETGGAALNWFYDGSKHSPGIPSSQTSVLFDVDGSASSASLTSKTLYNWCVTATDANGNSAQFVTNYTPQ